MSLWLVRAGRYGEHEPKFIDDKRIYLTWDELTANDMTGIADYEGIKKRILDTYPDESSHKLGNWSGQVWAFLYRMQVGDWVVMPRKSRPTIAIGEVKSACWFDAAASNDYRHYREIKWLNTDIPRSAFDQDLLYSFGAFLTVCEIRRNDAEKRVRDMAKNAWHSEDHLEQEVLGWLADVGYTPLDGPDLAPDGSARSAATTARCCCGRLRARRSRG
jgi:restriction system protein